MNAVEKSSSVVTAKIFYFKLGGKIDNFERWGRPFGLIRLFSIENWETFVKNEKNLYKNTNLIRFYYQNFLFFANVYRISSWKSRLNKK